MTTTVIIPNPPAPLERVEAQIVELSSQMSGAMCELLTLVGEFDAAEGWRSWGVRSTAQWLSWKCGVGRTAGREQVRVARAMRRLPAIVEPFAAGTLSYSKVRAITRVATEETVDILVDWAQHSTAADLERIVAAQRRVIRIDDVRERHAARRLTYRWDDDGSLVGSFRLPPEKAARFLQGLEAAREAMPEPVAEVVAAEDEAMQACAECRDVSAEALCPDISEAVKARKRPTRRAADALVWMAEATTRVVALEESEAVGLPGIDADRFQLVVHTSAATPPKADDAPDDGVEAVALEGGQRLHPSTGRRLTCGCPYAVQTDDVDGNPLHLGRKTRRIRGRLARAVHHRDGGRCRFPGCTNKTTQIHHVVHWADGGPTCISNLISLCDGHHWLAHEGGWRISTAAGGGWEFSSPRGRTMRRVPAAVQPVAPLPHNTVIRADAVTGIGAGESFDLDDALLVLAQRSRLSENTA